MSKLTYSTYRSFLRALQMSRETFFVFIEGKEDSPFYDTVVSPECRNAGIAYQARRAEEIPGGTGGKSALLKWFVYIRQHKQLAAEFKGKKWASMFFLDKDVDDVLGTKVRSAHVVYTEHYDHEGYLFREGDIFRAAAAAARTDCAHVISWLGADAQVWRARAADRWKTWVKLCLLARITNISCQCSYSNISQVNSPPHNSVDNSKVATFMSLIQSQCGMQADSFKKLCRRVERRIEAAYNNGCPESVFKSKWYSTILRSEIVSAARGYAIDQNGLGRVATHLVLTLNTTAPWAEHFRAPLRSVLAKI